MNSLSKLITTSEVDNNVCNISYFDYKIDGKTYDNVRRQIKRDLKIESIVEDVDNSEKIEQLEFDFPKEYDNIMTMSVFTKNVILNKSLLHNYHTLYDSEIAYNNIESQLYDIVLLEIKNRCDVGTKYHSTNGSNFNLILSNIDPNEILKKTKSKIMMCSNLIASWGRIGPATNIIAHPKMEQYLYEDTHHMNNPIITYDEKCIDKIYVYRNNDLQKAGLKLLYKISNEKNDDLMRYKLSYSFVDIGTFPQLQYITIDIK